MINIKREKLFKHFWILANIIYLVQFIILAYFNLNNSYIWIDESNQYWISRGQIFSSEQGTRDGTIGQVYELNKNLNLDPGGYTFYLRIFTDLFPDSIIFLRSSAFIFYLFFYMVSIVLIKQTFTDYVDRLIVIVLLSFSIFSPDMRWYSVEIRAYSMSAFSALLLMFLTLKIIKNPLRNSTLSLWIIAFTLAISTRYTNYPYAIISLITLFYCLHRKNKRLLPILVIPISEMALMYLYMTKFQNGAGALRYTESLMFLIFDFPTLVRAFSNNFWGYPGILRTLLLVSLLAMIFLKPKRFLGTRELILPIIYLNLITLCQIIFSTLGLLPWQTHTRWALEDYSYTILATVVLASTLNFFKPNQQNYLITTKIIVLLSLCMLVLFNGSYFTTNLKKTSNFNVYSSVLEPKLEKEKNVQIGFLPYSDIRYLAERNKPLPTSLLKWKDTKITLLDLSTIISLEKDLKKSMQFDKTGLVLISSLWDLDYKSKVLEVLNGLPNAEIQEINEFNTIGWILVTWSK